VNKQFVLHLVILCASVFFFFVALGSELYQEAVAKALARRCDARFLKLDSADMWLVQVWERAQLRATASFEYGPATEHPRHLCPESSAEANSICSLMSHSAKKQFDSFVVFPLRLSPFKANRCVCGML
jgi:hypothetical protein